MATYWTLATGGHEKQLPQWGVLIDFSVRRTSKGLGTVTLRTTENFDPGAAQWAFKQKAILYRDRVSLDGTPDSFSAGTIVFQGYFDDPVRKSDGGAEHIQYSINNVWWLFGRNLFAQYRNEFAGFDATHMRVSAVSIDDPGTGGYVVGDVVTVAGGTGTPAAVNIVAVDGSGNPTVVGLANGGGSYTVNPASPNTPTGGSGLGLKLTLGFSQAATYTQEILSEIYLGEQLHAADGYTSQWPNGNGDQIGEIIDWMNLTYNPTRHPGYVGGVDATQDIVIKGTIDPHTKMPVERVNTLFCDEAIKKCLRWDPDAVIVEDPATTPPTIGIRKLGKWNYATTPPTFIDYTNLPEVALNITAEQERQILLQSQLSRVLPGVIIYFKSVDLVDGVVSAHLVVDKYPGTVDDWTPEVARHTIELAGERLSYNMASITSAAIAQAVSGTAADRKAWWIAHDKSLDVNHDPGVKDSSIAATVATLLDDTNAVIDPVKYPYELLDGAPNWAGAKVIRARISATISRDRYADGATQLIKDASHNNKVVTKTLRLTNIPSGTYRNGGHYESAEVPPIGIAESVYRSLAATQYAGSISFVNQDLRSDIAIGCRLKLIGPNTTFSNLLVQQTEAEPVFGRITVTFGPCPPVDLDSWIELARASRARITYDMPSGRGDGNGAGNSALDTGLTPAADDTSHGLGGLVYQGVKYTIPP